MSDFGPDCIGVYVPGPVCVCVHDTGLFFFFFLRGVYDPGPVCIGVSDPGLVCIGVFDPGPVCVGVSDSSLVFVILALSTFVCVILAVSVILHGLRWCGDSCPVGQCMTQALLALVHSVLALSII